MRLIKVLTIVATLIIGPHAKAAFIAGGSGVDILTLDQDAVSFYDYTNGSANTGFETTDTLLFFIAEYSGMFHLFGLFDSPNDSLNSGGVNMFLEDNSSDVGEFLFVDDQGVNGDYFWQNPTGTLSEFRSGWAQNYSDGFVYQIGGTTGTDITVNLSNLRNIDAVEFVNFGSNGDILNFNKLDNEFNITFDKNWVSTSTQNETAVKANAPSNLMLTLLPILFIGLRRHGKVSK